LNPQKKGGREKERRDIKVRRRVGIFSLTIGKIATRRRLYFRGKNGKKIQLKLYLVVGTIT